MSNFKKEYHNPLELIQFFWPTATTDHIIYDPTMRRGEYNVIRQSGGDGTLLFTYEMLQDGLINIVNGSSYYKRTAPKTGMISSV